MDQNNEQFRPEEQEPVPAEQGVEYYTEFPQGETPKPRSKKALIISLVSAGSVLVAAAVVALVLFLPILAADPLGSTMEEVFFDPTLFSDLSALWQESGAESRIDVNLPKAFTGLSRDLSMTLQSTEVGSLSSVVGHTSFTLTFGSDEVKLGVYYSPEVLAIQGLYQDPEQFLSIPRKEIRKAMEASIFHPDSGSKDYALDSESYEELIEALESLDKLQAEQEEELRKIMTALEPVLTEWSEILTPESKIGFAKGAFRLERRVEYRLDQDDIKDMINSLLSTAETDPTLKEYFYSETDESLAMLLVELKDALPPTYEIVFSYTVSGGRIASASCAVTAQDEDMTEPETFLMDLVFSYAEEANGFVLTMGVEGEPAEQVTLEYQKKETEGTTEITFSAKSEEDTSEGSLVLDHTAHTYTLTLKEMAPETDFVLTGALEVNRETGVFRFTVDKATLGEQPLLESTVLEISTKACESRPALPAPAAAALLSMTEEEFTAFLRQLPLYNVELMFANLTGQSFGLLYTIDQKVLLNSDACMEVADDYYQRYVYLIQVGSKEGIPVANRIFIYNEELDVYVLMSYYSTSQKIDIDFAYEMTESRMRTYHEAVPDNELGLTIHRLTENSTVDPTCDQFGQKSYHCSVCDKDYVVEISPLGHKRELDAEKSYDALCDRDGLMVEVCTRCGDVLENPVPAFGHAGPASLNMMVTTDDNQERYLSLYTCNTCGEHYCAEVSEFITVYLDKKEDGTYTITSYQAPSWGNNSLHIQIPEDLIEQAGITQAEPDVMVPTSLRSAVTIRVPSFMTTISANTFSRAKELQVLVLPSTVTTIESGAFYKSIPLHVIYFEGTEEQWNAVEKNEYAELWKNVAVIFCPEGASAKTVSTSFLKASIVEGAVSIAKDVVNGSAAGMQQLADENTGLTVLTDTVVRKAAVDPETGVIAYYGAYDSASKITVIVVLGSDLQELHRFTVSGDATALAVGSDYVVVTTGQGDDVYVHTYRLSDGEQVATKIGSQNRYQYVDQILIVGDRVFLTHNDQHCEVINFFLSTKKFLSIQRTYEPTLLLSPDRTRLLIVATGTTHKQVFIFDTANAKAVGTVDAGNGTGVKITVHSNYIELSDGTMYDLNAQVITERPVGDEITLTLPWNYMRLEVQETSTAGTAYLCIDTRYVVKTVLKNAAGQTRELDFYAEKVLFTPDGRALVYTPNGYGLLLVELNP
ncbi:MAG: hypothetical protein IJX28_01520 [Clostridia bacterium]|nr:hypothetical protein [Clostridia bacterium]